MAVLVEALSVIVRRDAIDRDFKGGWTSFQEAVPNGTLCYDDELARVGFMSPDGVGAFLRTLHESGIAALSGEAFADAAVVDQQTGPTLPAPWLEFGKLPCDDDGHKVSACWLFEGPRRGHGLHFKGLEIDLATPINWSYEGSLSASFEFIRTEDVEQRLTFLRRDPDSGADVFRDNATGKEVRLPSTG